jgi:IclR family acetate operon transcriptional repressor
MLVLVSHESLKQLARETGETAHLAVRQGKEAMFIDHVATNHLIAVAGQTGERIPMYCTAHGKALLVDFDKRQLRNLFGAGPLEAYTDDTIVSIEDLAMACAQIRARGFATDNGEYQDGVRCVAAPIRDGDGVVGSIGISAPAARMPDQHYEVCSRAASSAARRISKMLSDQENGRSEHRAEPSNEF